MKIISTLILASLSVSAYAMPLYEPFNYAFNPPDTNIVGKTSPDGITWAQAGPVTGVTNVPSVNTGNLSYPGLAPSIGNSLKFGGVDSGGMGVRYSFPTTVTSGTVYFSFVLKVTDITSLSTSGVFWAGFNNAAGSQATVPNVVGTRVYARASGGGFNLGVSKNSSTTSDWQWDTTVRNVNDVIFVVGSYQIINGLNGTDDICSMWINPPTNTFGAGTPPAATLVASTGADMTGTISPIGLASFTFYNRSSIEPRGMIADELLISTNWADVTPVVPAITTQPQPQRALAGNSASFNVSGYKIAGYQWRFNGANIAGQNGNTLNLNNVQAGNQGSYDVIATNGSTSVTSIIATLTVVPDIYPRLRQLWSIPPNTTNYPYVTSDTSSAPNLRNIAYNALSNQVLVASRTNWVTGSTNPAIYVLDATTGTNMFSLDTGIVSGGSLYLTCIDVADDGAVYACNETTVSTGFNAFHIYRWPSATSGQGGTLVFDGIPDGIDNTPRWGDTMRVRGSGVDTEIIADSADGNWFAVFKPTDSSMAVFQVTAHTNFLGTGSVFGRSLEFGDTNSFYATHKGGPMEVATYDSDLFSPVNVLTNYSNFPTTMGPMGFSPGSNTMCAVNFSSSGVPDTLNLFSITDLSSPVLITGYNFPTNHQANGQCFGNVLTEGTNVYALDSNNGIVAMTWVPFKPTLSIAISGANVIISWPTNATGYTLYSTPAVSPTSWSLVGSGTIVGGNYQVSSPISAAPKYYRLQQ